MKICLSCEGIAATEQQQCEHCGVPLVPTEAVHFPIRRGEIDAANPLIGTVIDSKYLLQGVLGRGGMGTVFRACHTVSLVPVALKLLHPRWSVRAEYRRALLAEARKAGRVVHDHCARVLDVGETEEGTVYLAMELAEGEPLDAWVRGRGLPAPVVVDLLRQICRALAAIHAAGLVHRDLSSRNVMVAVRGGRPYVKVLDFGIAQSLSLAPRAGKDHADEPAFANPVFSAPEHLAGQEVDARADLYSLGVIAHLLLAGQLPVDEHDARAAARATVAGELHPLPSRPGVPRRLLRLVQDCLQRDRDGRPPSAHAVLAELAAIEHGRFRSLPPASLLLLGVAVVLMMVTFGRGEAPFLRLIGDRLQLAAGALQPHSEVRHLQSRDLQTLSAHFGGFPPDQLEVEVTRDQLLQHWPLRPAVDRDGVLVLSTAQQEWCSAVAGMAQVAAAGPFDLAFVLPGRALLGSVRLQLDDEPPTVEFALEPALGESPVVRGDSSLHLAVHDQTALAELSLTVRFQNGEERSFQLAPATESFPLGEQLRASLPDHGSLGRGELAVVAVDRAGNRTEPPPVQFVDCDLRAPAVLGATGPENEPSIPFVEGRARLRIRLSGFEPALRLSVLDPGGAARALAAPPKLAATGFGDLELAAAPAPGEAFPAGPYTFVVEDAIGNRTENALVLVFRNRRIDPGLRPVAGDLPVELLGDEVVVGPLGGVFEFTCNPLFACRAELRAAGNRPVPDGVEVRVEELAAGRARVLVPPLPPGAWRLVFELEELGAARGDRSQWERRLRVLPPTLTLALPSVRARFLKPLVARGLFEANGELLRGGGAIRIEPELAPYLRGRLWAGAEPTALTPMELPAPGPGERILPPMRLLPGRNVLALELRDVLGRPVAVTCDDRPAERLASGLVLLADFWHDHSPPQQIGGELRVEHGQSARLRLRCALPFEAGDAGSIKLGVGNVDLTAVRVTADLNGGAELEFVLPFAAWSAAADLDGYSRADFGNGIAARFEAEIDTPAGQFQLRVTLRTTRTTLRALQLGDVVDGQLPPALAAIRMVPVLAPVDGRFADPVPAEVPGRPLFRPQPPLEVRNCRDFCVQDREFTLGQYAALLAALPLAAEAPPTLVHADDPLGRGRLRLANMVPAAWQGEPAAFHAAAAAAPAAAVTGLGFFQAYTAVRLLGLLAFGDADLLRLPLGCELELAAFGAEPPGAARNGVAAHGKAVAAAPWLRAGDPAGGPRPGPTLADLVAAGDVVPSSFGAPIHGLDFGVREWVLDLPLGTDPDADALLREWIADQQLHCQRAQQLALGVAMPVELPAELRTRLRTFAVARGLPLGSTAGLLGDDGLPLRTPPTGTLPPSVPGVVRGEQIRRDGRDIGAGVDPRLSTIGFRVVGGSDFVARVRGR